MELAPAVNRLVRRYMAWAVMAVTLVAFFAHGSFTSWVHNDSVLGGQITVNHLLMLVMFGMGLTMKGDDFAQLLRQPKAIATGCAAQFTVMPLLAFLLGKAFRLPPELAVGVMLVGTCPGGTSSNVMTYMARGDIALSVGMTTASTLLAPLLTPLLTWLCLRTSVRVDAPAMFLSIVQVVIVPVALGFAANRFLGRRTQALTALLPLVSVAAICTIVGYVIDANHAPLLSCAPSVAAVVVLHNLLGYAMGFLVGQALAMPRPKRNAIAIEVGMQNSGLATSLAATAFPAMPLATVPGVVFSVWHNLSGAVVANLMARHGGDGD